ncbi:MAG: hydrogenase maturation protease [Rhodobacteraceae bacterium]|nr:hydrogenase maturation protease [Paracoccaceae bacterium]
MRILVAGVGNALRGDDGFGVFAVQALGRDPRLPQQARVIETGIGGIHLVQELMAGYGALIVFDALDRAAAPGRLFLVEPELPDVHALSERKRRDFFADVHYATPVRALTLAREIGVLPGLVRIIGCQPADPNAFGTDLHADVAAAIPAAVEMALEVIAGILRPEPADAPP